MNAQAATAPRAAMARATAERPHGVRRGCTCCSAPDRPARMRRRERRTSRQAVRAARYDD
jgi:hypothetical protein